MFYHPKYYAALRKQGRKPTSSKQQAIEESVPYTDVIEAQAPSDKPPNQRARVQASSQSSQAPGSDDQGTSAQAHGPGYKQQG